MSRFNASISIVGIDDPKVQQAVLKLLENSSFLKKELDSRVGTLTESLRRQKSYFDAKIKELQEVK